MTATIDSVKSKAERVHLKEYPAGNVRFDWVAAGLSAWALGGVYLDGWAHNHGQVDDSFFTPWHAVLYSGLLAMFVFLGFNHSRNVAKGHAWPKALPKGYLLSLAGAALFLLGGALDFLWHTLFGIEVSLEAFLSPTHLLLATSGVLVISGPMRAACSHLSPGQARGWPALGPLVLSATLVLSVLTFFTQFVHPISQPVAQAATAIDQGQFSDLYAMNADGTGQTRLTASPTMSARYGAWSPDGRQIVFARTEGPLWAEVKEGHPPESALYLMNADGSGLQQLTDVPGQESMPAWSPDSARIAFVSGAGEQQQLYAINADGSNLQPLAGVAAPAFSPAWSPDGARIVYTSNAGGTDQLYVMNADGSNPVQLTANSGHNWGAVWSPDGRQIAFNGPGDDDLDIYVINADGNGQKRLTDTPAEEYSPTWSPDGRQIAFVAWRDGQADIYAMNADGSSVRNLTHSHALEINFPKWSPDGKTIMFSAQGHSARPNLYDTQTSAIASILLQSALLTAAVLMLVRAWTLPFGALTLLFTVNGLLMSVLNDQYLLALPMLGAGFMADILLRQLKPAAGQRGRFSLFAFIVPVLFYALYFLVLQLTQGIGWTIHLWLGSIFMAGITGLLVSFLILAGQGVRNPNH